MFTQIWKEQRDQEFHLRTNGGSASRFALMDAQIRDEFLMDRLNTEPSSVYEDFIASKNPVLTGYSAERCFENTSLFDYQRDIVHWALRRGRAAIFADCGLGKTPMQLTWAENIVRHTGMPVLIYAPLAVNSQTVDEGRKFGIRVTEIDSQEQIHDPAIYVTNYEKMHKFRSDDLGGLVLDESSILKSFDGKTRNTLIEFAKAIPYRLCCTATPAPNDVIEIANHSEFLGLLTTKEIRALYFRLEGNSTHKWRLKHHAEVPFWEWLAQWSVCLRKPSDLGYSDAGFTLPALNLFEHEVVTGVEAKDGIQHRATIRKATMNARISKCAEIVNAEPNETWVIWCELNTESKALLDAIPGAVELTGSQSQIQKENTLQDFRLGLISILITKPGLSGFGVNWQHARRCAFIGLSDSYEQYYQAIRREWRFGQKQPVHAHVIVSDAEKGTVENIKRKEIETSRMMDELIQRTTVYADVFANREDMKIENKHESGTNWDLFLGDCVSHLESIPSDSIGLSVFSPPFPSMYVYTNSPNDVGNVKSLSELIDHMVFVSHQLLRVLKPGRSCAIHLTQAVAFLGVDGYIGFKDFRGSVIDMMERTGWTYYGEVCIDKNPQVKAIRTHDAGLLFKSLATDSSKMHMCLADYVLQFKKPGKNETRINAGTSEKYGTKGWISAEEWIEWAAPVWYRQTKEYPGGIKETDVLKYHGARGDMDEKHICPLQLGVIERAIKLWSNPDDIILDPFAGIGSTGVKALELKRRFVGIELKPNYFEVAAENLFRREMGF